MSTAPAGLKILRIALIQGSKITEDRSLKKRGPITIGTDSKNTFVVPVSNLPAAFTLFEFVNNQYALVFTEQMEGKVKIGDSDLTFAAIKQQGLAAKRGTNFVLPLKDTMKGRVAVGEVSLLFQFVTPPPEPPRPELPANIKGGFWSGIDRFFFTILGVSLLIHMGFGISIRFADMPEERELALDELPDRFAKIMMPVQVEKPPEKKVEVADKGEDKKEEKKEEKKAEVAAKSPSEKKAEMTQKVASKGLLKVLGSQGSGSSAFADVLGNGGGSDIASALAGAGGVQTATADSLAAGAQKGGGTGTAAGIGDLGTKGGGNVDIGSKSDTVVRGKVADSAPEVDSADVDREALAKYVKSRKAAIQGCYEKELKRNPTLKGKVTVRFTISTSGRATDIGVDEDTLKNDAVSSCITSIMRSWVFPFKPPSEVPVAYPFVFSPAS